jgi:nitroreductase
VLVQNPLMKQQLADKAMIGAGNQYRTRDCSALAVFLADLEAGKRIQRIYELEKEWNKRHPTYLALFPVTSTFMLGEGHAATLLKQFASATISELDLQAMPQIESIQTWAYKNTSLSVQSYVLASSSHGLATSIMEGFDSLRMKQLLQIPDRYGIPMVVATGFDFEEISDDQTPRLGLEEVVFSDTFGNPFDVPSEDDPTAAHG